MASDLRCEQCKNFNNPLCDGVYGSVPCTPCWINNLSCSLQNGTVQAASTVPHTTGPPARDLLMPSFPPPLPPGVPLLRPLLPATAPQTHPLALPFALPWNGHGQGYAAMAQSSSHAPTIPVSQPATNPPAPPPAPQTSTTNQGDNDEEVVFLFSRPAIRDADWRAESIREYIRTGARALQEELSRRDNEADLEWERKRGGR